VFNPALGLDGLGYGFQADAAVLVDDKLTGSTVGRWSIASQGATPF
jgi:hypothetical protein